MQGTSVIAKALLDSPGLGHPLALSSGPGVRYHLWAKWLSAHLWSSPRSCIKVCIIASSPGDLYPRCSEQHWLELTLPHLLLTELPSQGRKLPAALQFRPHWCPHETAWTSAFLPVPGEYHSLGLGCGVWSSVPWPRALAKASCFLQAGFEAVRAHRNGGADQTKGEGGQSIDNDQVCTWVQACPGCL